MNEHKEAQVVSLLPTYVGSRYIHLFSATAVPLCRLHTIEPASQIAHHQLRDSTSGSEGGFRPTIEEALIRNVTSQQPSSLRRNTKLFRFLKSTGPPQERAHRPVPGQDGAF
ncbi:hypothetical protein AcV5_003303 [Taiwanofungus camphoratus]|nr:hypothetical protein AcV5_003303 [Antrodia cinnamomea]KAI0918201.1 hypothetical protein AcV7_007003 [Antrodia cinnamomea]